MISSDGTRFPSAWRSGRNAQFREQQFAASVSRNPRKIATPSTKRGPSRLAVLFPYSSRFTLIPLEFLIIPLSSPHLHLPLSLLLALCSLCRTRPAGRRLIRTPECITALGAVSGRAFLLLPRPECQAKRWPGTRNHAGSGWAEAHSVTASSQLGHRFRNSLGFRPSRRVRVQADPVARAPSLENSGGSTRKTC